MTNKSIKKNIILLLITLIILFIIVEFSLRLFYQQPIVRHKDLDVAPKIFNISNYLPWQLRTSSIQRHRNVLDEFDVLVQTNSLGYRDKEFKKKKEEGVKRILIVGDSMTFGWGVENNETYSKILGRFLNNSEEKYEVINAGYKSGFSPDTEYLYFKKEGLELKPDILIVGFLVRNDFSDYKGHTWFFDEKGDLEKIESKVQYVDSEHRLRSTEKRSFLGGILYDTNVFVSSHSHFYVLSKLAFKNIIERATFNNEVEIYSENYNEEVKKDVDISFEILLKFKRLAEENNIKLVVVLIPNKEGVYDYKINGINWTKPHDLLKDFGEKEDIEVIDLLADIKKEYTSGKDLYFKVDKHLNKQGHYEIGKALYLRLKEKDIVE